MVMTTSYQALPLQDESYFWFGVRKHTVVPTVITNCVETVGASVRSSAWMVPAGFICYGDFYALDADTSIMNCPTLLSHTNAMPRK